MNVKSKQSWGIFQVRSENSLGWKQGARDGLPIAFGYLSVSFTFGMAAAAAGLSVSEAVMISATNLTSAGQFAGLTLIQAQASFMEMALTTLIINLRYALMSLSLAQKLDPALSRWQKAILAFGNTDEIFAVAVSHPVVYFRYMLGLILTPMAGWVGGTFLGCAFSALLPTAIRSAFAVAIYGMFIAIIAPVARQLKSVAVVIGIAVILSVTLRICPWFSWISEGFSIILCTIIAAALGAWLFPVQEAESTVMHDPSSNDRVEN